jgi:multisubunit Na+/H+ antiporter MnhG subunit
MPNMLLLGGPIISYAIGSAAHRIGRPKNTPFGMI